MARPPPISVTTLPMKASILLSSIVARSIAIPCLLLSRFVRASPSPRRRQTAARSRLASRVIGHAPGDGAGRCVGAERSRTDRTLEVPAQGRVLDADALDGLTAPRRPRFAGPPRRVPERAGPAAETEGGCELVRKSIALPLD